MCNPFGFDFMTICWLGLDWRMYCSTPGQPGHQVKAKSVAHIVTATYSNLSQVAHEISSGEASKGGKFEEGLYMDILFLQLLSHVLRVFYSQTNPPLPAIEFESECSCLRLPERDWELWKNILPPSGNFSQTFVEENKFSLDPSLGWALFLNTWIFFWKASLKSVLYCFLYSRCRHCVSLAATPAWSLHKICNVGEFALCFNYLNEIISRYSLTC